MKPSSRRIRNGLVVRPIDPNEYVTIQYQDCVPYTISRKEWDSLPIAPKPPTEKQKAVIRRVLFGREPKPKKESKPNKENVEFWAKVIKETPGRVMIGRDGEPMLLMSRKVPVWGKHVDIKPAKESK